MCEKIKNITKNHKVLLTNGTWKEFGKLKKGDKIASHKDNK